MNRSLIRSISSNTRSVSPTAPTNTSQPPATSDNTTFSYMQPGPTAPVAGDSDADFNRLSNNRNLTPIRPRVTVPDMSLLVTTPKKS